MMCLVRHWLPGEPMTQDNMAEALFLENRYWTNMKQAVAAGIAQVL